MPENKKLCCSECGESNEPVVNASGKWIGAALGGTLGFAEAIVFGLFGICLALPMPVVAAIAGAAIGAIAGHDIGRGIAGSSLKCRKCNKTIGARYSAAQLLTQVFWSVVLIIIGVMLLDVFFNFRMIG